MVSGLTGLWGLDDLEYQQCWESPTASEVLNWQEYTKCNQELTHILQH